MEQSFMQSSGRNGQSEFFPKLSVAEIITCLTELGFTISKDELAHPDQHKELIKSLLEFLSEICLGISRDELTQPAFAGLHAINYPELHEESIPMVNSIRAITRMMEVCDVNDFSIRDLMCPDAKRLKRQLSGIINFAKFREERRLAMQEINEQREGLIEKLAQAREKHETMNSRLSQLRTQTAEEEAQIQTLEKDIDDIEGQMKSLQDEVAKAEAEKESLQARYMQLKEEMAKSEEDLEGLKNVHKRLSSQIVSSPEKFRRQIIEIGQSLRHEQNDLKTGEKKLRELAAWIANVEEAQKDVNLALEAVGEVRAEVDKQKGMLTEVESQRIQNNQTRAVLSELSQNTSKLSRSVNRGEEKLQYLRKTASERAKEAQQKLAELSQEIVEAEAFKMQVKNRAERLEGELHRLEDEMQMETEMQESELSEMRTVYGRLEKKIISHLQDFQKVLEENMVTDEKENSSGQAVV